VGLIPISLELVEITAVVALAVLVIGITLGLPKAAAMAGQVV